MSTIITRDELKAKAGITDTSSDAQLDLAIEQSEGEFEAGIGQKLLVADYTERREGTGKTYLQLQFYPFVELVSLVIEDEAAFNIADPAEVRVSLGTSGLPWLTLTGGRVFNFPRWRYVPNVTVVYAAGYENQAAIKAALPDVWSTTLEHAYILHFGNDTRKKQKASESYMGQSYSTFLEPIDKDHERSWKRLIEKYRRRRIKSVATRPLTETARYGVWR